MNTRRKTALSAVVAISCIPIFIMFMQGCSSAETTSIQTEQTTPHTSGNPWQTIMVTGYRVNLRSGPGTQYTVEGQVFRGDSLQVTGGLDEWYRVYVPHLSLFAWIYGPLTTGAELP